MKIATSIYAVILAIAIPSLIFHPTGKAIIKLLAVSEWYVSVLIVAILILALVIITPGIGVSVLFLIVLPIENLNYKILKSIGIQAEQPATFDNLFLSVIDAYFGEVKK
jgi:hypothetical protein